MRESVNCRAGLLVVSVPILAVAWFHQGSLRCAAVMALLAYVGGT
jgi:hypothetical protein